MPNRIVRDGILTSEKVDLLSESEELFFRRLMSVADDYGKYSANPKLLLSACYPLRTATKTLEEISMYLAACEHAGLLKVYKVKGAAFLELSDFRQRLRLMVSKWPGENGQITDACRTDDGHVTDERLTTDGVNPKRREEKTKASSRARAREPAGSGNDSKHSSPSKQAKHLLDLSEASIEELQAEHPKLAVRALMAEAQAKCAERHPHGGPMKLPFFREFLKREEQKLDPSGLIETRKEKAEQLAEATQDRIAEDAEMKRVAEELRKFRKEEL